MSQDLNLNIKTILIAAKGEPLLISEIYQKLQTEYKYKGTKETVRRNLNFMEKMKNVRSVLHLVKKKNAWIYWEHDNVQNELKPESSIDLKDAGIKHSEYIKKNIIDPWLQQLPTKNSLIFLWSEDVFPVEKDEIFHDFKNHIKSDYGNPFEELDMFKQILYQFLSIKREIQVFIDGIFIETQKDIFNEKLGSYSDQNMITDFIISQIIKSNTDFRSIFINDFTSHVEEKNGTYFYYTMNYPKEMIAIFSGGAQLGEKNFKEKMDKFVNKLVENTGKSERMQKEITALCELQEKLYRHVENMRKSLKNHFALEALPNSCEYCS